MGTATRTQHTPGRLFIQRSSGDQWEVYEQIGDGEVSHRISFGTEHAAVWYIEAIIMRRQRDALLAALEALRGDLLRYPNDDARREAIVDAADAAIAAARGTDA